MRVVVVDCSGAAVVMDSVFEVPAGVVVVSSGVIVISGDILDGVIDVSA